jgi:uncharacterized protein (DUF934 family)
VDERVTWSIELVPRAETEIASAQDWYEAQRAGLGRRFLDEVESMFERIATMPTRFPRWQDDARYQRALLARSRTSYSSSRIP